MKTIIISQELETPKPIKKNIKYSKDQALEEEEKKALLESIKTLNSKPDIKYKYEVLVCLMMYGGLRVSEAIQTRLEWFIDTPDGVVVRIPNEARNIRNLKKDWKPKTKAGNRESIFIDSAIGEKIKSYYITHKSLGINRFRAYQIIKMLGQRINKPQLHPHALRSTYANSLVYRGVNATTLMYYMGWSNLNTALHYIKTSNIAARRDLLEKMRDSK